MANTSVGVTIYDTSNATPTLSLIADDYGRQAVAILLRLARSCRSNRVELEILPRTGD